LDRNPANDLHVHYEAHAAGRLSIEVFDVTGRRLERSMREVAAHETGDLKFARLPGSGIYLYRLHLDAGIDGGVVHEGKAVIVK
jgi:hypothetical protein